MKFTVVTTENMGSCWCGDCECYVYEDGSIQYSGSYRWQNSDRRMPIRDAEGKWAEPFRHYRSDLTEHDYLDALAEIAEEGR